MAETVDLLSDLTPAQRDAVQHLEGPLLILAGAGSGKTRVITRRVAYLLHQGVPAHRILAITFTNKAAGEMRQRVEALMPNSRVWISTFHSLGARLMRQYADRLSLDRNFTIYDQSDRNRLVKAALDAADIDHARFTPERIESAISKAKNQLLGPEKYAAQANDFFSQTVARVYPVYEKKLRDANAVDFDDLLYWPALALRHEPELRAELDARFRFVLIDEYQDTNYAQYQIARGLSVDEPNLCVVGDPDQCLPPDTLVETPRGRVPVASLSEGDEVVTAVGWGDAGIRPIEKVMVNPYRGTLVKVTLENGSVLRATPNHLCFGRLRAVPSLHHVYLLWKRGVGYRLGTTRGVRASKDGEVMAGLPVRSRQEAADAMWIVRTCRTSAECRSLEHYLSVKYGIPTLVSFVRSRRRELSQDPIDQLSTNFNTEAAGLRLMEDHHLDRRYPYYRPGCAHRVQLVASGGDRRERARDQLWVHGTWQIETSRNHYEDGLNLAQRIRGLEDREVIARARLTVGQAFALMPASHLQPSMGIPILQGEVVVEATIRSVAWEAYDGPVYDLSVPQTRNFVANGVVVHNSIYGWRGSNIRNILDFEKDFPNAQVITLDRNYRSTQNILSAASHLIAHNKQRKPKDLVTHNPAGMPVTVLTFETGQDEADGIARRIQQGVQTNKRAYRDFAVFLRINALSRSLEQAFLKHRVPFQIVRGLAFFERKENRDVLAYLRLLVNGRDDLSFLRVVNEPSRGIGKTSQDHLKAYAEPREMSLLAAAEQVAKIPQIKGKAVKGLADFAALLRDLGQLRDAQPDEVIRQVLDRTGYRRMLATSDDPEDAERLANVEELVTAAKQFAAEDTSRTISDFLENITLASDVDAWNEQQDCVSVMTLHAAKGLEFPVVYMAAVEQGILPHERSLAKDAEVEEERRLCFVGMTRAKEELNLCHGRLRDFRGQTLYAIPSMFLEELPREGVQQLDLSASGGGTQQAMDAWRSGSPAAEQGWIDAGIKPRPQPAPPASSAAATAAGDYAEGMLVRHATYGLGKITSVTGYGALRTVKIRFQTAGERAFRVDKANLEVVQNQ